jgi:hypothetical protein
MRNGQNNKRMRGRNRGGSGGGGGKSHNPLTRVYESNGPDIKIRGTASHIAEKYIQLARDAQTSGDPVSAENYYQHAEHYFRLIAAAQEQFRQTQPYFRAEGGEQRDDNFDDGDEDGASNYMGGGAPGFGPGGEPQPYLPRDAQPFPAREQNFQPREQQQHDRRPQHQPQPPVEAAPEGALPSFITGGQPPQANGHEGSSDRFPLHRRRRRHRGPRGDTPQGADAPASE